MTFLKWKVYKKFMTELSATATPEHAGTRLDRFLSEEIETLSRSRAKTLVKEGAVRQAAKGTEMAATDPRAGVVTGVTYIVAMPEPVAAIPQPENIPLDVLFEDEHLIMINKPSGMAVHPAPGAGKGH